MIENYKGTPTFKLERNTCILLVPY